jgi:putative transposase
MSLAETMERRAAEFVDRYTAVHQQIGRVIGGTETHVHVAVTVPPTLLVSDFVGQLKEASSHEVNQQLGSRGAGLQWQAGYGAVSFGTGDLEWVKEYIRNQREHHRRGSIHDRLERIIEPEPQVGDEPRERG